MYRGWRAINTYVKKEIEGCQCYVLTVKTKNLSVESIIDIDDYEKASQYSWRILKTTRGKASYLTTTLKSRKALLLHRLILNPKKHLLVDHINGNTFDNRKINLREVDHYRNSWNKKKKHMSSCEYLGLSKDRGRIKVCTSTKGNREDVYGFKSETIAAIIYDLITHNRDEHSKLNFDREDIERLELWIQEKFFPNIRQICIELQAAREYFSKDREVRQISLKEGLRAASNAWQDREDLLQKYYEVTNGKG